jgi:hypothetical protein
MKLPNQDYKVIRSSKPYSSNSDKSYGKLTVTIWFKGVSDLKDYKTHIVKGHDNESNWSAVMGQIDSKPTVRFDPGKMKPGNIIDADSVPHIVSTQQTSKPTVALPVPDIFSEEPQQPPLTPEELRGFKAFVQHVEAYLANPELLETARQAIGE